MLSAAEGGGDGGPSSSSASLPAPLLPLAAAAPAPLLRYCPDSLSDSEPLSDSDSEGGRLPAPMYASSASLLSVPLSSSSVCGHSQGVRRYWSADKVWQCL